MRRRWVGMVLVICFLPGCNLEKAQSMGTTSEATFEPAPIVKATAATPVVVEDTTLSVPNFTLPVLNPLDGMGGELELASLKGKVVLLNFWATWCASCRKKLPNIEKLHQLANKDPRFVILGVANEGDGASESQARVERFLAANHYTLPVVIDNGSIFKAHSVRAIPHMVLLDKNGAVAKIFRGSVDNDVLQTEIMALLQ